MPALRVAPVTWSIGTFARGQVGIVPAWSLEDGSVVMADEQSYEMLMYDAGGNHVWTSGREGEGPEEYGGLRLSRGCPGAEITVFDSPLDWISEPEADGKMAGMRSVGMRGVSPYESPACTSDGKLGLTPWPNLRPLLESRDVGENYRWTMTLSWQQGDSIVTLHSGIPGTERTFCGSGTMPRVLAQKLVFAAAPADDWFGSSDDHELRQVDWNGCLAADPPATLTAAGTLIHTPRRGTLGSLANSVDRTSIIRVGPDQTVYAGLQPIHGRCHHRD